MLRASTTAFLLVTSAQADSIDEAIWLRRTLEDVGIPFAGVVVNRVHHDILNGRETSELNGALVGHVGAELAQAVAENFHDYHVLARRDGRNVARLESELGGRPLLLVPHLDDDVHDMAGLARIHRYLFASDREREQMIAQVIA
jgi:anion-transporting  ArsA/GET3 family ATPase